MPKKWLAEQCADDRFSPHYICLKLCSYLADFNYPAISWKIPAPPFICEYLFAAAGYLNAGTKPGPIGRTRSLTRKDSTNAGNSIGLWLIAQNAKDSLKPAPIAGLVGVDERFFGVFQIKLHQNSDAVRASTARAYGIHAVRVANHDLQ